MNQHLRNVRTALALVFVRPCYIALASALALVAFLLAVWFPNIGLMREVFSNASMPLSEKVAFAWNLLGSIATNFSTLSAAYTVAIAGLFGICTAMIVYLLKLRRAAAARQNIAIGVGGIASGIVGIGCAACGTLLAGAVLPFLGASAALAALPLQGGEFGILSVALLAISLGLVSKSIVEPAACPLGAPPLGAHGKAG